MKMNISYIWPASLISVLLVIWEIAARLYDKSFLFPSPTAILLRLWELKTELFIHHLPPTALTILIGLSISIIVGSALAIAMYSKKLMEQAFYPILIASQTIPIIALAPIFVLWFGYSIWSKVAVTVLITFFPITVSVFDGLRSSDRNLRELMRTMGASAKDIFYKLDLPSALPSFFSGLKVAVTLSVIGAAIGEWLGAQAGLGYFSRRMMTQFDSAAVFAPIVLLSAVGILFFLIVVSAEKYFLQWRNDQ
ncbi:ABC transporter permease [Sporosarcina sp. P37]|uniref:ABC transporter permease n=1 Tax=unclassified Sporosarcina TaxID=2647733 RepID=UPI000A17F8B2|nr:MULTISPECIES: ABC transporter permease [unclassified Sporosarcina]ARK25388.1 ABC transporter permease [Sporosarcina sp. P37]PID19059.1 ABC transporter permease [Sporosarcina sp. P35]